MRMWTITGQTRPWDESWSGRNAPRIRRHGAAARNAAKMRQSYCVGCAGLRHAERLEHRVAPLCEPQGVASGHVTYPPAGEAVTLPSVREREIDTGEVVAGLASGAINSSGLPSTTPRFVVPRSSRNRTVASGARPTSTLARPRMPRVDRPPSLGSTHLAPRST